MTQAPIAAELDPATTTRVITRALRRWQEARLAKLPLQPALFRGLKQYVMLAPVLDSLFRFYEAALDRALTTSRDEKPSDDERLLVSLIDCPDERSIYMQCPRGIALGFDSALRSTRIMLAMAIRPPETAALR